MILESDIRSIVEKKMHQIGGFLVDVKVSHNNDITVLIDLDDGVTFDHCTDISKYIESYFDRETEDFSLKVRILPGLAELAQGKILVSELKEVDISDLLGR